MTDAVIALEEATSKTRSETTVVNPDPTWWPSSSPDPGTCVSEYANEHAPWSERCCAVRTERLGSPEFIRRKWGLGAGGEIMEEGTRSKEVSGTKGAKHWTYVYAAN